MLIFNRSYPTNHTLAGDLRDLTAILATAGDLLLGIGPTTQGQCWDGPDSRTTVGLATRLNAGHSRHDDVYCHLPCRAQLFGTAEYGAMAAGCGDRIIVHAFGYIDILWRIFDQRCDF